MQPQGQKTIWHSVVSRRHPERSEGPLYLPLPSSLATQLSFCSRLVPISDSPHRSTNLIRIRPSASLAASFLALSISALAQTIPPAVKAAEASIDPEKIRAHVKFLSDDLLEGRGPGLRGSELAAKY